MSDKHRLLLERAGRSYEKHEAGRQDPFNVFSVLRSESDEVNLHSRYLHALLDYQKPREETRENLTDFLQQVGVRDFEQSDVNVEREHENIDILVINGVGQAVVIENKIKAVDRPRQLVRYHQALKSQGYCKIHLLYLTLHGRVPSEESRGDLEYTAISYKDDLPRWLKRCQQRACDEPGLRESIAQYVQLVQKLTGTDFKEAYMEALTKLCLEGNNLVLVHDLSEAMVKAKARLLKKLWGEIECALKEEIPCLPPKDETGKNDAHPVSDDRIRNFFKTRRQEEDRYHGLHYPFGSGVASLSVEVNRERLFFGIRCHKKHKGVRRKIYEALDTLKDARDESSEWWPWHQEDDVNLRNPSRCDLALLSNEAERKKRAKRIATSLKPFWEAVKAAGLT